MGVTHPGVFEHASHKESLVAGHAQVLCTVTAGGQFLLVSSQQISNAELVRLQRFESWHPA